MAGDAGGDSEEEEEEEELPEEWIDRCVGDDIPAAVAKLRSDRVPVESLRQLSGFRWRSLSNLLDYLYLIASCFADQM